MRQILGLAVAATLVAGCGPKTLEARMARAEKRAEEAGALLDDAERALAAVNPEKAEGALAEANKILVDPDITFYPEHELLRARLAEAQGKLELVRSEAARIALEKAVAEAKVAVNKASTQLKKAVDDLKQQDVSMSRVRAAQDALKEVQEALDDHKELVGKDKGYAEHARGVNKLLDQAAVDIRQSEKVVLFLEGPVAARRDAAGLFKQAVAVKDVRKKLDSFAAARTRYQACADEGRKMIAGAPELKKAAVVLDESVATPDGVVAECLDKVAKTAKAMGAWAKMLPKPKPPKKAASKPAPKRRR